MYKESELKWVYNTVSGTKRQVGPNIYGNPFRMKTGNWQLIDPPSELVKHELVAVNMPVPTCEEMRQRVNIPGTTPIALRYIEPTLPTQEFLSKVGAEVPLPADLFPEKPAYEVPIIPDPIDPIAETPTPAKSNKKR